MSTPRTAISQYETQKRIAARAASAVKKLWGQVGSEFDSGWSAVMPTAVAVMAQARADAVQYALPYTTDLMLETGQAVVPRGSLVPATFLAATPYGTSLEDELVRAPIIAKTAVSKGRNPSAATKSWLGMMSLTMLADTRREVYSADMTNQRVTGFVRMLNPPSCKDCAILAGKWFRWNEGFERHPHCDCIHIPAPEAMAGDFTTDPYAYFSSLSEAEQDRLWGAHGAQAIRDGADIYRVTNVANRRLSAPRALYGNRRMTVQRIYEVANGDQELARRMLERYGYILPRGQVLGTYTERFALPISRPVVAGSARDRTLQARARGTRDPLDRATMTAAERRVYDAWYKFDYAQRTGFWPTSVGASSMTRYEVARRVSREQLEMLRNDLNTTVNSLFKGDGTPAAPSQVLEVARLLGLL